MTSPTAASRIKGSRRMRTPPATTERRPSRAARLKRLEPRTTPTPTARAPATIAVTADASSGASAPSAASRPTSPSARPALVPRRVSPRLRSSAEARQMRRPPANTATASSPLALALRARGRHRRRGGRDRRRDHAVDQAVLDRLFRRQEVIAVGVALHALDGLAGVLRGPLVQHLFDAQDFAGVDVEVRGLALEAPTRDQRLVHVDAGVGEREAPALVARHQDHGAEAGGA